MRLNIFNRAHFTAEDEKKVRDLIASPEVEKILDRVEQAHVDERTALRNQLDSLDKRHEPAIEKATTARIDAAKKLEAGRAVFDAAKEADKLAAQHVESLAAAKRDEDYRLRKRLIESRDDRLDEFHRHLSNADELMRYLYSITEAKRRNLLGRMITEYSDNNAQVDACREVIKEALEDVTAMALLPLSRADVAARLTGWTHRLEPMLERFQVACPRLDEAGKVTTHRPQRSHAETIIANGLAEEGDRELADRIATQREAREARDAARKSK